MLQPWSRRQHCCNPPVNLQHVPKYLFLELICIYVPCATLSYIFYMSKLFNVDPSSPFSFSLGFWDLPLRRHDWCIPCVIRTCNTISFSVIREWWGEVQNGHSTQVLKHANNLKFTYITNFAINDLISKSRLFIDVFTSWQPIYCKFTENHF